MTRIGADEWGIMPAFHVGDAYFTCALAETLRARHGGAAVKVIVPGGLQRIAALFPDARLAPLDPEALEQPLRDGPGFALGEPFYLRPLRVTEDLASRHAGKTIPFTQCYTDLLELPLHSFARPHVPQAPADAAARRFAELGLPAGRTAILVPFSYSLAVFTTPFWAELAAALAARGLTVVTNVAAWELDRCVPGTSPLPCPLEEVIPLAELAGTVIASRCGVCDLLSSASTDLRILYHRPQFDWSPVPGVKLLWDLADCGLEDHATYFRMGADEEREAFITRVAEGRP